MTKEDTWPAMDKRILPNGFISYAALESVIGRLSFAKTTVF